MQLLINYVSSFICRFIEQIGTISEMDDAEKPTATGEALLVKAGTETEDDAETVTHTVEETTEVSTQLGGIDQIVFNPWAHLSDGLTDPHTVQDVLDAFADRTAPAGHDPLPIPFGWYKERQLRPMGRLLSVLTRAA